MNIGEFDHLEDQKKRELLQKCCGSTKWVDKMIGALPAEDLIDLLDIAEEKWYECNEEDWKEAFLHHPEIGNLQSLKEKFSTSADVAAKEQSGVNDTSDEVLQQLAEGNKQYKEKFGHIFITYASGKTAEEMLNELNERLKNTPEEEIKNAMEEQLNITKSRIEKLFV